METPKNTGPPVTWDESESESNEKWCIKFLKRSTILNYFGKIFEKYIVYMFYIFVICNIIYVFIFSN